MRPMKGEHAIPLASEILWLGEAACHDQSLVGGKVANLSRLAADHRVPTGFCLTTAAYARARNGATKLSCLDGGGGELPESLGEALAEAYGELAARCGMTEPPVAVRSSAVDEDGIGASFAGQHESYLNIAGVDAVARAVRRCWASAHSPRALDYRRRRGLSTDTLRMAVLVQRLVPADISAVVFSANPVTGSQDEVVVNASWGLGESVVGGTVTPDSYVVRKTDLAVLSRQIGEKERMTVLVPGGTQEVVVPRLLRSRRTLDEDQLAATALLAVALEASMGWPVDVECAYRAGELFLLQCRPITTLQIQKEEPCQI